MAAQARYRPGQPGWDQVDEIVEPRGRPAEGAISGRAVADHAVHGIDGLVDEHSRKPEQNVPERRRHHRVGEVLGARLDRRAGDAMLVELPDIAADDVGDLSPAGLDAAVAQRLANPMDVPEQAALRQQRDHHRQLQQPGKRHISGEPCHAGAGGGGKRADQHDKQDPAPAPFGLGPILPVELAVEPADHDADQPHRMRQPRQRSASLAQHRFQRQCRQE